MNVLPIVWQRLVDTSGHTCVRCSSTQQSLERSIAKLKAVLAPLGLKPVLETREISESAFREDPSASNRIWIAERPLEEWLGARTGSSPCCSVCGDSDCRTVEIGEAVFEEIPEELILKAALAAAARMLAPASDAQSGCCEAEPAQAACCTPPQSKQMEGGHTQPTTKPVRLPADGKTLRRQS